jgi:hypothetical protein
MAPSAAPSVVRWRRRLTPALGNPDTTIAHKGECRMTLDATRLQFVTIPKGSYQLGWRFSADLPGECFHGLEEYMFKGYFDSHFSHARTIRLEAFEIATTTIPVDEILGNPPYALDDNSIEQLCHLLDEALKPSGFRLPTEDEMEAAAGGSLFSWGMEVPEGEPYEKETSFTLHKEPNSFGLILNSDPYMCEVCRHALKYGDGGCSICGGDPWPAGWLALSPSHHLLTPDIQECFYEFLETTFVRPVRLPEGARQR